MLLLSYFILIGVNKSKIEMTERVTSIENLDKSWLQHEEEYGESVSSLVFKGLGSFLIKFSPSAKSNKHKKLLEKAGVLRETTAEKWVARKAVIVAVLTVFLGLLVAIMNGNLSMAFLVSLLTAMLVNTMYKFYLSKRITKRTVEIVKALPYTLDLITVSVEAGLSLDGAIGRIVNTIHGPLSEEFGQTLKEMRMGIEKKEALKNMSVFKTEARVINPDGSIRWSYYISRPRIIKGLVCWDGIEIDISDRKRMEFELRQAKERAEESEQQFRQLFENAADAIFIANENTGIILDVNRASENLMKMPKAEIIGKHQSELHPPEVKDYASKTFSKHKQFEAENKLTRLIENKVLCSDGTSVPVEILASKVTFKGKKCLVGTFRDISERKKTEQELLKTKEKAEEINANLTAIIEGTNDSIWAFNKNYEILYINKSFQQEFLNSFGVLLEPGVNLIEALPQTLKPLWKPRYDKVLSNEHFSIEDAVDTKNGVVYIQVTFNPIVKNGEAIGGSCFGTNITSRKLAEIELLKAKEQAEESEMKFSKLFHISPEPQTVTSLDDGRFIMVNDSFLENIGYSKEEIINRTSIDINAWISSEDRQRWVDELKSKGAVRGLELPFRTRHQGIREYLVSSDIIDLDGKKSTINTYLDITERKQNEEELTKAKEKAEESDRLKTAFLQNMSHEIRTPMNAIMGFSQLLAENYDNKQKLEQFSKIIYQRCSDLLEIINDILNISKIESGQLALNIENCNINELFSELSLFYEELQKRISKQHIKLKFQHESNISHAIIQTDRVKLKQILINLISNAFKFTEFGSIECGYKQENNKLIFYVTDTGIGISKDKHELIFERFLQIHNRNVNNIGGTGLGLSIAKGLTELLGGEIWLESEPGKGTTFKFSINYIRSDKQEYKSVIQNENNELDFLNKTILIVEDDIYNAEYLNEILSETGINIIQTKFGKNAIEIAQIQDIDLILMDVRLPDLNGYEATKTIKHSNPDIIIIAQTAYAAQEEKQKALNAGCIDYISKPTKRDLLISLLNRYLKDDV